MTVSANNVGDKIFFGRYAYKEMVSFDCVSSQGVPHCSSIVNLPAGTVAGFTDENTVVSVQWVEGASPIVTTIDVMTGNIFSIAADTSQLSDAGCCVVNGASMILMSQMSSLYVLSARHGEEGEVLSIIKDLLRNDSSVVSACGEPNRMILM
jgi:hypothetical protein